MEEFTGPLATLWGTYYPKEYVVAVVDDRDQAQQAVEALQNAGWPADAVRLFSGEEVLANDDRFQHQRNLIQRFAASLASAEGAALRRYLEEARRGRSFVTVHAPQRNRVDELHRILDRYGAHTIKYYAPEGIADLHP